MAAVGHDEQPAVADLAGECPGLVDRDERIAVAADDQRRRRDRAQLARRQQRLGRRRRRRSPAAGAATRPAPWPGSWRAASSAAHAGSSRRIRSGSMSRRATLRPRLALGSRSRRRRASGAAPVPGPRTRARSSRPSRSRSRWKVVEAERVDEAGQVVDEPVGSGTRRRRPSASAVAPGVGQVARRKAVDSERDLRRESDLGRPIDVAPWSMTSGGPAPSDLVADLEAVGAIGSSCTRGRDRLRASARACPPRRPSPRARCAGIGAGSRAAASGARLRWPGRRRDR